MVVACPMSGLRWPDSIDDLGLRPALVLACPHLTAYTRKASMPWNPAYYPASMDLPPVVREKAIEVADALREEGMDEGKAIRIAIAKAKEWATSHLEAAEN